MLTTLAISNYRSILDLRMPLGELNVITGPNGSGKSNLYKALRLLADTAREGVVRSLALEGGLRSTMWAGPEEISRAMRKGDVEVQGSVRKGRARLKLGFAAEDFSYAISLGFPKPDGTSNFNFDPEIKYEAVWAGPILRPSTLLVKRDGSVVTARAESEMEVVAKDIRTYDSIFGQLVDTRSTPELFWLRERIREWRFYDHFRTDRESPARLPQIGTRTPVLSQDGSDLVAALQTILEVGDRETLRSVIDLAFPGCSVGVDVDEHGKFSLLFNQKGLLRPLTASELSDGTLRFLLLAVALLTPRPPSLMVLNEPETSLHVDVLPALAKLIHTAAGSTQIWVVSHSPKLIAALKKLGHVNLIELKKTLGRTGVETEDADGPVWRWPD